MRLRRKPAPRLPSDAEMEQALRRFVSDVEPSPATRESVRRRIREEQEGPRRGPRRWGIVAAATAAIGAAVAVLGVVPGLAPTLGVAAVQSQDAVTLYAPGKAPVNTTPGVPHAHVQFIPLGPTPPPPTSSSVRAAMAQAGFRVVVITSPSAVLQGARVVSVPNGVTATDQVVITYQVGQGTTYLVENGLGNANPLALPKGGLGETINGAAGWYLATPGMPGGEVYWIAGHLEIRITGPLPQQTLLSLAKSVAPYKG